jgi:hypothetical protein
MQRFFFDSVKLFFWELARFLNGVLRKLLIIKGLRPAARPGAVSRWLSTVYKESHSHKVKRPFDRAFYDITMTNFN